jgi:hypothetical protein
LLVVNCLPDMQVPKGDRDHLAGNHVLLRCTHAPANATAPADVLHGQLRPGSARVAAGATVAAADRLGSVGNGQHR